MSNFNTAANNAPAQFILPEGFTAVTDGVPSHDRPVLAIRVSSYVAAEFEVMTARYMVNYRPRSPWRDIGGDAVSDSGEQILGWREAPELFKATRC